MKIILILVCALAICTSTLQAELEDFSRDPRGTLDYSGNPFIPFQRGASIYLGKFANIIPAPEPAAQRTEGHATLQISEVLRGPKVDVVTLLYSYWTVFPRFTKDMVLPDMWPRVAELPKDQQFLVVVLSGPFKNERSLANEASAACAVYQVTGPDDPLVKAYRQMIALQELRGPALMQAAMKAADQTNPIIRAYLASTALYRLQRSDGVALATAVTGIYLKPDAPDDSIGIDELGYTAQRGDEQVKAAAVKSLIALLESPNRYTRDDATWQLLRIVDTLRTSDCYFPADERKRLLDIVTRAGPGPQNAQPEAKNRQPADVVKAWLAAAPGTLAVSPEGNPYLLMTDPYYALHHGAAVYTAQLVKRTQTDGPKATTSGAATLQVTSVLQGAKREAVTLDYSYHASRNSEDHWPNLDQLPKDSQLLCIILPKEGLPADAKNDADLYACNVLPISGPDDALVKTVANMLTWDALNAPALKQALLTTPDLAELPRWFFYQTVMQRLNPGDAVDVLAALAESKIHAPAPPDGNFYDRAVFGCMDNLLGPSPTGDPALQDKVIHIAADATGATDLGFTYSAVDLLASLSQQAPDGAKALSDPQKENVRAAISRIGASMDADEKSRVLQWINR